MTKEPKLGDNFYEDKGRKKLTGYVKPSSVRLYRKAAKRRGWSMTQYVSYWLTIKAPKG